MKDALDEARERVFQFLRDGLYKEFGFVPQYSEVPGYPRSDYDSITGFISSLGEEGYKKFMEDIKFKEFRNQLVEDFKDSKIDVFVCYSVSLFQFWVYDKH